MSRRRNPDLPASLHPALRAADGAPYFADAALEEANREGETYKSRTSLVLMDPADFLRMADPGKEEARQVALEQVLRAGTRLSDVPRLFVDYDKESGFADVTGHEGRHRSRSLLARGVKQMPVRIHTTNIRWSEQTSPRAWDYIEVLPHTLAGEGGHARNQMPMPVPIHYPELAERMMKKNPAARTARTSRASRAPKTYLFSYGSNSPRQLAERLGHPVKGRAAFVEGHLRAFRGWSNRWEGGVATLIPGRGKTFGYIAEVTPEDLAILDRYEGVATGNYRRANMKVTTNDGETVQAIVYLASSTEKNAPSRAYKRAVAETIGAFWKGENGPVTESDITVRNPARWFGHLVTDDQKVTISKEPIAEVQNTESLQKAAPKPRGLWYACGSEWIEWLEGEMPHWLEEGQNLYEVVPRYSEVGVAEGYRGKRYVGGVLRITTDKEMEMFDLGFHVTDMQIDWPRVASIWDGIEICPYQYSFRDIYGWYYGWDVASGCIWRPSGADGLTLLHSRVARSTPPRKPRGFGSSRQRHTSTHGPRNNPRRMDGSVRPTRATQVNAYLAENGFPGVMLHRSARDAYCHFYGGDANDWDETGVYVPRIRDLTLDGWLEEAQRLAQTKRNPRRRNPKDVTIPAEYGAEMADFDTYRDAVAAVVQAALPEFPAGSTITHKDWVGHSVPDDLTPSLLHLVFGIKVPQFGDAATIWVYTSVHAKHRPHLLHLPRARKTPEWEVLIKPWAIDDSTVWKALARPVNANKKFFSVTSPQEAMQMLPAVQKALIAAGKAASKVTPAKKPTAKRNPRRRNPSGPYTVGEKYFGSVSEVRYLPVSVIYRAEIDFRPEILRVSDRVAQQMNFSEPVDVVAYRGQSAGWAPVYPPQMWYPTDEEIADTALPVVKLVDGHHRLAAAIQTGREWLPVSLKSTNARGEKLNALVALSQEIEARIGKRNPRRRSR